MIEIVPMAEEHINGVVTLEEATFSIPWTRADFEREVRENTMAIYYVALMDGRVVGYAGMWHVVTEGHITNVGVLEEVRCEGIGSRLIEHVALSSGALCGALCSGGSSFSGRGCCAAGRAATAGCQRQGHDAGHGKTQLLFHSCVLLLPLFARCSNNSQCCATMLRIRFTILRIQDFCAGVNVHNLRCLG